MAPEVISLLSSPEPEPLPLPTEPPKPTSTSLRALQQKWDFSALDDLESAERIPESSAPVRSVTVTKFAREEFFDSDDFDVTGPLGGADDFDVTGDLGGAKDDENDEEMYLDDRPSKRRRLSEDPLDLPAVARPAKRVTSAAPRSSHPRGAKPGVAPDLIELSSSPVRPARPTTHASIALRDESVSGPFMPVAAKTSSVLVATTTSTVLTAGEFSDFSNPFVSSSPPPAKPKPQTVSRAGSAQTSYAPRQPAYKSGFVEEDASKVPPLMRMGFTDAQVRKALRETANDLAKAIDWLYDLKEGKDGAVSTSIGPSENYDQPKPRPSPNKAVAWDPISSSAPFPNAGPSSPPVRAGRTTLQRGLSEIICLDDSDGEDAKPQPAREPKAFSFDDSDTDAKPTPVPRSRSEASKFDDLDDLDLSEDEFPDDLTKIASRKFTRTVSAPTTSGTRAKTPSSTATSKPRVKPPKKSADDAAREKISRQADRERVKLAREAEKERKKQEALRAKEQKAQEKTRAAALAEANRNRTDKKVSTPEMIVDLPESLSANTKMQVEIFLKDIGVEYHYWASPVEGVVKWRRKVRARYNEELALWDPIPPVIEPEKHVMVILPADQFVDLVLAKNPDAEISTLDQHVAKMNRAFPDCTLLYLVQGMKRWMTENKLARNRRFQSAVTNTMQSSESTTARRKKNAPPPREYVDEEPIEDALLSLQIRHRVLIHHVRAPVEIPKQIGVFTQQLSTSPYKKLKEDVNAAAANFCIESGQVRTGDGARDTYAKMLEEVNRITAPIAYGIIGEFPTVPELVRGLERGGPGSLEDVRKCADAEGTVTDNARRIGPSVSKRMWGIFTGRDPDSLDV